MWSLCPILTEYSSYIMKSNETTKYFILMMFANNLIILFSNPSVLVSLTLLSNGSNSVPVALILSINALEIPTSTISNSL